MNNNNGRGIFYGVIGVATLVVAIIGATFAYFTASANNATAITGNAATVGLSLAVSKVSTADNTSGMIPMSNSMVEAAVSASDICTDANGNAVCQIYKITLTSSSTAAMFVDGYVALAGGSGQTATDYPSGYTPTGATDMRWAQVFCTDVDDAAEGADSVTSCTTANNTLGFASLDARSDTTGKNTSNIKTTAAQILTDDAITTNYIRVSGDKASYSGETTFGRTTDLTTALVYNQNVAASGSASYYVVVWLSETGTDQTIDSTNATGFFNGVVKFESASGGEVSASFSGYSRVTAGA